MVRHMKIFLTILCLLILVSCSKPEVPSHRLIENGGLFYELDSNKPFSGISIHNVDTKLFSKTYLEKGITLRKETFYPQGTMHTIETFTEGVGGNKVQVFDEEGKDISNELYLTLWDDGSIKSRGNYTNGKKEGVWEEFDRFGNSLKRTHWENNLLIPITNFEDLVLRENVPYMVNSSEPYSGIIRFPEGKYFGVLLQEFKNGKPNGIHERRHKQENGGHLSLYCSHSTGSSFDYEDFYIKDMVREYVEESFCSGTHKNGKTRYESIDKEGLNFQTSYYQNGQISIKGQYFVNTEEGLYQEDKNFTTYHENGQVMSELLYDKGVLVSGKRFSESGMDISNGEGLGVDMFNYPERKGYYLNGFKEGKWEGDDGDFVTYRKDSKEGPSVGFLYKNCTTETGSYKNNKKEGEWIDYKYCKEDDDPSELIYYENGKLVER